jgi:hypothetical protein
MDLSKLKEPFPADAIHWRVGATTKDKDKGIALAYLDARNVMERLDEVVGPENWQCEYPFAGCCRIGIYVPPAPLKKFADGSVELIDRSGYSDGWVWKSNGAGATDIEGEKGQYSDSFKRAAVLWGIGRYLYDLPNVWVPLEAKGRTHIIKTPPKLPAWALPLKEDQKTFEGKPVNPAPASKEDEQLMYLEDLCKQHKHKFESVLAAGEKAGKSVADMIEAYEGLNK